MICTSRVTAVTSCKPLMGSIFLFSITYKSQAIMFDAAWRHPGFIQYENKLKELGTQGVGKS